MKHPVLDYLLASAVLDLNDKHNKSMLANGQYIPWWKRHLLLVILLALLAPSLLIGAFIVFANVANPSPATVMTAMKVLLYGGGVLFCVGVVVAYIRAERRWNREANKPTKVINVR